MRLCMYLLPGVQQGPLPEIKLSKLHTLQFVTYIFTLTKYKTLQYNISSNIKTVELRWKKSLKLIERVQL